MNKHYYLTPVLGGPGAPRYPISEEPQLIGRSERAAVALLEPTVSREHAAIQLRDSLVYLEDLGSKHGTFVNSKRITSTKLKVGDIIVFGLSLVLRLEESDEPLPPMELERLGAPEHTVSAIQPLPAAPGQPRRARVTQGTAPLLRKSSVEAETLQRALDQLARTRKLAATGALCAVRLPEIYLKISRLLRDANRDAGAERERLATIADDLQQLIRAIHLPAPQLDAVSLLAIVNAAVSQVKSLAEPRGIHLLIGIPDGVQVAAEADRLTAALVELLRNATQASADDQSVEINAEVQADSVVLTVTDHGEGLPEGAAERIFDPFFTLRDDRSAVGLGLFEARQSVLAMGGGLRLEPGADGGTVAEVLLGRAG